MSGPQCETRSAEFKVTKGREQGKVFLEENSQCRVSAYCVGPASLSSVSKSWPSSGRQIVFMHLKIPDAISWNYKLVDSSYRGLKPKEPPQIYVHSGTNDPSPDKMRSFAKFSVKHA